MKKKIIWALATLSTFPLIAASCQNKNKKDLNETKPSKQNELSEKDAKQIKELKHATKISKKLYQEIEKSNPEDKLLTQSKSRIQKFFADFEAKLSKEINSDDVQNLDSEFSNFLEHYLITIYIKYDYKDLRDHILKTFPDLKTKIDQVDIKFNEVSSRNNNQEKNAFSSLVINLNNIYVEQLLKTLDNNPDAVITLPESRYSKIYPERNLEEIKMAYSGLYNTLEIYLKKQPEYQEKLIKINKSLNDSSTMRDYSVALFRLNHLTIKFYKDDLNNDKDYRAARDKYYLTYQQALALFDKEKDKLLYEKLMQIDEHLSSTPAIIEFQEATSEIEKLIKEKKETAQPNTPSNTNQ